MSIKLKWTVFPIFLSLLAISALAYSLYINLALKGEGIIKLPGFGALPPLQDGLPFSKLP